VKKITEYHSDPEIEDESDLTVIKKKKKKKANYNSISNRRPRTAIEPKVNTKRNLSVSPGPKFIEREKEQEKEEAK